MEQVVTTSNTEISDSWRKPVISSLNVLKQELIKNEVKDDARSKINKFIDLLLQFLSNPILHQLLFVGATNAGKSTLFNRVISLKLSHSSQTADTFGYLSVKLHSEDYYSVIEYDFFQLDKEKTKLNFKGKEDFISHINKERLEKENVDLVTIYSEALMPRVDNKNNKLLSSFVFIDTPGVTESTFGEKTRKFLRNQLCDQPKQMGSITFVVTLDLTHGTPNLNELRATIDPYAKEKTFVFVLTKVVYWVNLAKVPFEEIPGGKENKEKILNAKILQKKATKEEKIHSKGLLKALKKEKKRIKLIQLTNSLNICNKNLQVAFIEPLKKDFKNCEVFLYDIDVDEKAKFCYDPKTFKLYTLSQESSTETPVGIRMGEESLNHIKEYLLQYRPLGCDPHVARVMLGNILQVASDLKGAIIDHSSLNTMINEEKKKVESYFIPALEIGNREIEIFVDSELETIVENIATEFIKRDKYRYWQSNFASELTKYIEENIAVTVSNKMATIILNIAKKLKEDLAQYYSEQRVIIPNISRINTKTQSTENYLWSVLSLLGSSAIGGGFGLALESGVLVASSVVFPPLGIGVIVGGIIATIIPAAWSRESTATKIIEIVLPHLQEHYKMEMDKRCKTYFESATQMIFVSVEEEVQKKFEKQFHCINEEIDKLNSLCIHYLV